MIGPEGAAEHVRRWLEERLPARLRMIEQRLTLEPSSLPDPVRVLAQENGPIAIEDWPSVYVLPQRLLTMNLTEVRADASEVYRCTYGIRVLALVRADGYAPTDRLRKRYVLATREALLERKQLAAAQTYGSSDYGLDVSAAVLIPESMREDYSDVMTDEAGRTIAGAFIDVSIAVAEVLAGPPALGTATDVEVTTTGDTSAIPPHPGL